MLHVNTEDGRTKAHHFNDQVKANRIKFLYMDELSYQDTPYYKSLNGVAKVKETLPKDLTQRHGITLPLKSIY